MAQSNFVQNQPELKNNEPIDFVKRFSKGNPLSASDLNTHSDAINSLIKKVYPSKQIFGKDNSAIYYKAIESKTAQDTKIMVRPIKADSTLTTALVNNEDDNGGEEFLKAVGVSIERNSYVQIIIDEEGQAVAFPIRPTAGLRFRQEDGDMPADASDFPFWTFFEKEFQVLEAWHNSSGGTYSVQLSKNGTPTGATITNNSVNPIDLLPSNIKIVAGDKISCRVVSSSSATEFEIKFKLF